MRKLTIQDWSDLVLFKQLLLNYEDIVPWTIFAIYWNFFFRRVVSGSAGTASQTQVVFLITTPGLVSSFVFYFFFIFLKPMCDHFHRQSFPCFFLCTFFSTPGALIVTPKYLLLFPSPFFLSSAVQIFFLQIISSSILLFLCLANIFLFQIFSSSSISDFLIIRESNMVYFPLSQTQVTILTFTLPSILPLFFILFIFSFFLSNPGGCPLRCSCDRSSLTTSSSTSSFPSLMSYMSCKSKKPRKISQKKLGVAVVLLANVFFWG